MNDRHLPAQSKSLSQVDLVLPKGARLGPFEVQRLIARGASSFVYLATDHALALPVVLQEYLAARMVYRDAWLHLHASDDWHEDVLSRGMRLFIDESRLLARCEHPALVRVQHLFEANGTAYRVMPFHPGQRLSDVRAAMTEPPSEAPLRALLDPLLGALETIHRLDQVHGGVSASNILLIDDDFPLLLSPGAAARELRSDLVESLMATVESQPGALLPESFPTGPSIDLCALAEVIRFCITGDATPPNRPRVTLAALLTREVEGVPWPAYSDEFIGTLDAATSSSPEDWPTSVAQFRLWLAHGTPAARAAASQRALSAPAAFSHEVAAVAAPQTGAADPDALDFAELGPAPSGPIFIPIDAAGPSPARPPAFPAVAGQIALDAQAAAPARRFRGLGSKLLFGSVLAGVAVAFIAWISGAWNVMPAITLEHGAEVAQLTAPRAGAPLMAPKAPFVAPTAAPADGSLPSSSSNASPLAQQPLVATPSPTPAPMPTPMPTTPTQATTIATPEPGSESPDAHAEAADPAGALSANPPGAGAKPRPARVATRTRTSMAKASRAPADPRTACAGRTEFALYRCMRQQCQAAKWITHPQCVRLRLDDRVD